MCCPLLLQLPRIGTLIAPFRPPAARSTYCIAIDALIRGLNPGGGLSLGTYRAAPRHTSPSYLDTRHKRPRFFGALLFRSTRMPDSSSFRVAVALELDVGKDPERRRGFRLSTGWDPRRPVRSPPFRRRGSGVELRVAMVIGYLDKDFTRNISATIELVTFGLVPETAGLFA